MYIHQAVLFLMILLSIFLGSVLGCLVARKSFDNNTRTTTLKNNQQLHDTSNNVQEEQKLLTSSPAEVSCDSKFEFLNVPEGTESVIVDRNVNYNNFMLIDDLFTIMMRITGYDVHSDHSETYDGKMD